MTFIIAHNQRGPLPLKIPFTAPISGNVTIAFSGTCWSSVAKNPGGVEVFLDDKSLGTVPLFFNDPNMHLALPTQLFIVRLTGRQHTLGVRAMLSTIITDSNDYFSAWIID